MIYIGIDISSRSFMVHAINEKKKVLFNEELKPTRSGLKEMLEKLGKQTKLVVFEAGNQLKWVALTLLKLPGFGGGSRIRTHGTFVQRFSRPPPSTTRPSLRKIIPPK
jgi:hypothetical protein